MKDLPRVGLGWDIHRLVENRPLYLGGVEIPFPKGLEGHSDADVLLHAICDALLGACSLGDLGNHFPDTDPQYKGISSGCLLKHVRSLLEQEGWQVINLDCVVIAQAPRIAPYVETLRTRIASLLEVEKRCISVKGKTAEGLGVIGDGRAIAAEVVVLVCQTSAVSL